jgi:asparagine synthase (glutamine-hydrolysing)
MAAIAAQIGRGRGVGDALVRRLVRRTPFQQPAPADAWCDDGVALAAAWWAGWDQALARYAHARVVFDGRLDDRATLRHALDDAGAGAEGDVPDSALVARAYAAWGTGCFARLRGEFAVCVWDTAHRVLVAARDRCGVKPLFYSRDPRDTVVASSLAAVQGVPGAAAHDDTTLDEAAIVDFLLCGFVRDVAATCFSGIRRVPPASFVVFTDAQEPRVTAYWTPSALSLPAADPREYAGHFRHLLQDAVARRRDRGAVSVLMSGGLDSTSVAACAVRDARGTAGDAAVSAAECLAVTAVYDAVMADQERHFSSVAARALGMPIRHVPLHRHGLFDGWAGETRPVEPSVDPHGSTVSELLSVAADHAPVALAGDGGDPLMLPAPLLRHLGRVPLVPLARGLWQTLRAREVPPLGVRSGVSRWLGLERPHPPTWLSARVQRHVDVPGRWAAFLESLEPAPGVRGETLGALQSGEWAQSFEAADPNATGLALEVRYPFFDDALVSFALALPSFPWCVNKLVLREGMRGLLPDEVRLRAKSPLAADPVATMVWPARRLVAAVRNAPGIDAFVDPAALERSVRDEGLFTDRQPGTLEVAALATWLRAGHRAEGAS